MLLIGIDEAGYGPLIGPLCHGYVAFRLAHTSLDDVELTWPCLWKLLHPAVSKVRKRAPAQAILIDDSKRIHNAAEGYFALEKSVRAILNCAGASSQTTHVTLDELLPADDLGDLARDEWHVTAVAAAEAVYDAPEKLRAKLAERGVAIAALGARATSVRRYNSSLATGRNKAEASWTVIVSLLQRLVSLALPNEPIAIVIDCQGGRRRYTAPLSEAFGTTLFQALREKSHEAVYRIDDNGRPIQVGFFVEGDGLHLPIALASMCAKLTREKCMERLNAYFKAHQPDLRPTAGYYGDGRRFLKDTQLLRRKLNIADEAFIRVR